MNATEYANLLTWASELSKRYRCIAVVLVARNGVWSWRDYTSPAQARRLFNRKAVGHRGFPLETPIAIARDGVIMAQRPMVQS